MKKSDSYKSMLLERCVSDCEYFLDGHNSEKNLLEGTVSKQIEKMYELYEELPEKPSWITEKDLRNFELQMNVVQINKTLKKLENKDEIYPLLEKKSEMLEEIVKIQNKKINTISKEASNKAINNIPTYEKNLDEFLKKQIAEYCNSNNKFESYWCATDTLSASDMDHIFNLYITNPTKSIEKTIIQYLDVEPEIEVSFENYIKNNVERQDFYLQDKNFQEWFKNVDVLDKLYSNGFNGIDIKLDELLKNTNIYVDLLFATPNEKENGYTQIVDCFGSSCKEPELQKKNFDNSMTYLIWQQGYQTYDYFASYFNDKHIPKSSFIESLVEENIENTSTDSTKLTALLKLNGTEAVNFFKYLADPENNKNLKISKDTTLCAFNENTGDCGNINIELEKDFIVPREILDNFLIEGANSIEKEIYTIRDLCNISGECFKENSLSYTVEEPILMEENIDKTISAWTNRTTKLTLEEP